MYCSGNDRVLSQISIDTTSPGGRFYRCGGDCKNLSSGSGSVGDTTEEATRGRYWRYAAAVAAIYRGWLQTEAVADEDGSNQDEVCVVAFDGRGNHKSDMLYLMRRIRMFPTRYADQKADECPDP